MQNIDNTLKPIQNKSFINNELPSINFCSPMAFIALNRMILEPEAD